MSHSGQVVAAWELGLEKEHEKSLREMEMFWILISRAASQVYTPVKTHQIAHFKWMLLYCIYLMLPYSWFKNIYGSLESMLWNQMVFAERTSSWGLGWSQGPFPAGFSLLPYDSSCWIQALRFQKMHLLLGMNGDTSLCHKNLRLIFLQRQF